VKAAVYFRYGPPDVVEIQEVEKPAPENDQVLIRVRAASVNPLDWHFMRGTPYFLRLMTGLGKPKLPRLGVDVAGEIEAVGSAVTEFQPGDAVFGSCRGAFAEYVCTAKKAVALKPANITFEEAAAVPVAALTALQSLRNKGHIQAGQNVLVNGAAGGVGTFGIQLAKHYGTDVTGVCRARNVELVRSIGADRVIDYTKEDFAKTNQRFDLIFDLMGNRSLMVFRGLLKPGGVYVSAGGESGKWMLGAFARSFAAPALSAFGSKKLTSMLTKGNPEDLETVRGLLQEGKLKSVVDRIFPLSQASDAIAYLEQGHARGKVIVTP